MTQHTSPLERAKHIVIEGPIGAGKTTLARRLAQHLDASLVREHPELNPFLSRFYLDPERWSLATQLSFLLKRSEQVRSSEFTSGERLVTDFMIEKDALFADLTLSEDEFRIYEQIRSKVMPSPPQPDLVIYLEAPVQVLIERIRRRGVDSEQRISETYLTRVFERYTRFFYAYNRAPLFIVNTGQLNPVDNDKDFALLIERLKGMRSYREFFSFAS